MPCAPKRSQSMAGFTTSGLFPPLAFRSVAILLLLTLSLVTGKIFANNPNEANFVRKNRITKNMSLKEQIDADIKKAMMARNKEELEALRSIKSLILLAETEKGGPAELNAEAEARLLMKGAKQRRESAEIFKQQGREDLAERELLQREVIERYLPKQLSEQEIEEVVRAVINEVGAQGPQD